MNEARSKTLAHRLRSQPPSRGRRLGDGAPSGYTFLYNKTLAHRLLPIILLLAFGLRLYRLGAESLWYDETVSLHLAGKAIPALIEHTAGDIHPPGYYLLLHAWMRLAGGSDFTAGEFVAAFPSLFFGVLLTALACRLGTRLFGVDAGLLAAFLVAISPFNLGYSQEVRMYTLGAALGMGVLWTVVACLRSQTRGRLLAYAVLAAAGLWTLYYFAFLLVAVNLMVGAWWLVRRREWNPTLRRRWLGRWTLAQAAVLLLYAPWIPVAWRQATNPPVPPWRSAINFGDLLVQTWSALSLGQSVEPEKVWPALLLFAMLFGLGFFLPGFFPRRPGIPTRPGGNGIPPYWLLAGYVFLPVLLIYLASFATPLFHVRYVFTYSPPFYILVGAGLAWLGARWRPAAWLGLAVIVSLAGISIRNYHADPRYADDDHRAAVHFLAEHWRPGDTILVNAGYVYPALLTYWTCASPAGCTPPSGGAPIAWRGRLVGDSVSDWAQFAQRGPVIVQAGTVDGDPGLGWGDPASDFYAMSREETEAALERLFAGSYRVWVYRIYDTVTDPDGFVRDWLDEHSVRFEDQVFTGESQLRVQGWLGHRPPPPEILESARQPGEGRLRLLGSRPAVELASTGPAPLPGVEVGSVLDLELFWQRLGPLPGDLTLYAGLEWPPFGAVAQTDERPLGSLLPVAAWPQGEAVRTPLRLRIPPGTPPGDYALALGWYRFENAQPVWVWPEDGAKMSWGDVRVAAPQDWSALPLPAVAFPAGVTLGSVRFLGFDAPSFEARPGEALRLDLFWEALADGPEQAAAVLRLADGKGRVVAEAAAAPGGGRAPFTGLDASQVVRDPRLFALPPDLEPGVYSLSLGRRRLDGSWLPVRRGVVTLGETYPLATVRVLAGW